MGVSPSRGNARVGGIGIRNIEKDSMGLGMMAHLIKCLICKHEDLSLGP